MRSVLKNLIVPLLLLTICGRVTLAQDEETDLELIKEFLEATQINSNPEEPRQDKLGSKEKETPPSQVRPISQVTEESEYIPDTPDEIFEEETPCSCVKYFLCNIENGTVIDNGAVLGLIDIRLGANKKGSPCNHYFDICCKHKREPEVNPPPPAVFEHSACGKRNGGGVGFRITGASDGEAQFGEFPWMAAIVRQESQGDNPPLNVFLCGGSLIHPKVILTAAHCIFRSEQDLNIFTWENPLANKHNRHS